MNRFTLSQSYAEMSERLEQAAKAFASGAKLLKDNRPAESELQRGLDLLGQVVEGMPMSEQADSLTALVQ